MKDSRLALMYDNFDLQLTSCETVLGVNIDDNLTWTNHFKHVPKRYLRTFGVYSDKFILFFTTQNDVLKCSY